MQLIKISHSILVITLLMVGGCTSTPTQESTGEFLDSSLITAKIKTRLIDNPVTSGFNIKVDTFKGKVQLSGFVNTEKEKQQAEDIAKDVPGVKSVINNLVIKKE